MNWLLLHENKCPGCRKELDFTADRIFCRRCGFSITPQKFEDIVAEKVNEEIDAEQRPTEPKE